MKNFLTIAIIGVLTSCSFAHEVDEKKKAGCEIIEKGSTVLYNTDINYPINVKDGGRLHIIGSVKSQLEKLDAEGEYTQDWVTKGIYIENGGEAKISLSEPDIQAILTADTWAIAKNHSKTLTNDVYEDLREALSKEEKKAPKPVKFLGKVSPMRGVNAVVNSALLGIVSAAQNDLGQFELSGNIFTKDLVDLLTSNKFKKDYNLPFYEVVPLQNTFTNSSDITVTVPDGLFQNGTILQKQVKEVEVDVDGTVVDTDKNKITVLGFEEVSDTIKYYESAGLFLIDIDEDVDPTLNSERKHKKIDGDPDPVYKIVYTDGKGIQQEIVLNELSDISYNSYDETSNKLSWTEFGKELRKRAPNKDAYTGIDSTDQNTKEIALRRYRHDYANRVKAYLAEFGITFPESNKTYLFDVGEGDSSGTGTTDIIKLLDKDTGKANGYNVWLQKQDTPINNIVHNTIEASIYSTADKKGTLFNKTVLNGKEYVENPTLTLTGQNYNWLVESNVKVIIASENAMPRGNSVFHEEIGFNSPGGVIYVGPQAGETGGYYVFNKVSIQDGTTVTYRNNVTVIHNGEK